MLCSFFCYSTAFAEWGGYINDKTIPDTPYGYLSKASESTVFSQLKLVCFPPDEFELYIDDRIAGKGISTNVNLSVDRLPPLKLTIHPVTGTYTFTSKTPEFWDLIAQMAAGTKVQISTGAGNQHQYSLSGFTNSFLQMCGWLDSAERYLAYLDKYR